MASNKATTAIAVIMVSSSEREIYVGFGEVEVAGIVNVWASPD